MLELLPGEGLHRRYRAECLLDQGHHAHFQLAPFTVPVLHRLSENPDREHQERGHAQGEQSDRRLQAPHDRKHGDQQDGGLQQRQEGAGDQQLYAVGIAGDAGDRVAHRPAAVEHQGEPLQV